ncbi:hypothetical protein ACFRMN_15870 [Streptomyces sp. NPDC056835]|uniref:hypothetical protein n=1 Tax=Streptomyces sp. NPDC056835 TaxID=3345956 RepID=UPI00369BB9F7
MADQQLDTFDGEDDEDRKLREALSGFKEMVRSLVRETGLSTNQLTDMYGFGKGKVSTWQTAKPEQPNIPPLRFVEVLIKEARERANLQDRAAAVFLHQYGELLKLYCARANPHNVHRQMLLDYQNTLLIRELNEATNAALEKMAGLTEELETLRGDRDGERRRRITLQHQIDALRSQNQDRAAEKKTALAQRDQIRAGLKAYESDQQLEKWQPGAGQGGSHTYHPREPASVPPAPPSGPGIKRRGRVPSLIAVVVLVVSLAVYAGTQLSGDQNDSKNSADSTTDPAPTSPTPTPTPTPTSSPDPPAPTPEPPPRPTAPTVKVRWQGTLLLYSNGAPTGWWLDNRPPTQALLGDLGLECDCHPGEVVGNALAAWDGPTPPAYQQCSEMSGQLARRVVAVQEGAMACLRTQNGRLGYFTVTSVLGPSELNVEATIWDRQ